MKKFKVVVSMLFFMLFVKCTEINKPNEDIVKIKKLIGLEEVYTSGSFHTIEGYEYPKTLYFKGFLSEKGYDRLNKTLKHISERNTDIKETFHFVEPDEFSSLFKKNLAVTLSDIDKEFSSKIGSKCVNQYAYVNIEIDNFVTAASENYGVLKLCYNEGIVYGILDIGG